MVETVETVEKFLGRVTNEDGRAPAVVRQGGEVEGAALEVLKFGEVRRRLVEQVQGLSPGEFEEGRVLRAVYVCADTGEPLGVSLNTKDHKDQRTAVSYLRESSQLGVFDAGVDVALRHEIEAGELSRLEGAGAVLL